MKDLILIHYQHVAYQSHHTKRFCYNLKFHSRETVDIRQSNWSHTQTDKFFLKHHTPSHLKNVSFSQETGYSPGKELYVDQGSVTFNSFLWFSFSQNRESLQTGQSMLKDADGSETWLSIRVICGVCGGVGGDVGGEGRLILWLL